MPSSQFPSTQFQDDAKPRFQPTDAVLHVFDPNTPLMQVIESVRVPGQGNEKKIAGIRCGWFTPDCHYQSAIFNTNMLRHAEPSELPTNYRPRTRSASIPA